MRTVLITLIGPERTSDLVVDADTPVTELMPSLLSAGGVAGHAGETWTVALTGKQPVEPERTLEQSGVLDGAVLVLRREADAPPEPLAAPARGAQTAGSPLERTRGLLSSHVSPGAARRTRFRPQMPESPLLADSRQQALERAVQSAALQRCATIAVLSPKGGVGKTDALDPARRADVGAARRSGAGPRRGLRLRLAGTRRPHAVRWRPSPPSATGPSSPPWLRARVTFAELDRTLWALPGGLRIIPSPRDPAAMARTDRATYSRVIGTLQRLAGVLVVDCGTGLGQPGVQAAVLASDQLVLHRRHRRHGEPRGRGVAAARARRPADHDRLQPAAPRASRGPMTWLRLDALFPRASGLIGIPDDPVLERALRGELVLAQAPRNLREAVLELAAALASAGPSWGSPRCRSPLGWDRSNPFSQKPAWVRQIEHSPSWAEGGKRTGVGTRRYGSRTAT